MTYSTQSSSACQEKKEKKKKGILEMAYYQFSSFVSEVEQLSSYQTEVEPKTLSGSWRKSTSEELISKTQKYVSHFWTGTC